MSEIVPTPDVELVNASDVPVLLGQIRPAWQAKQLIQRVRRLLQVDPSSACQRLFNAAIHDLREKVVIAGVDIARDAAAQYKLPPLEKSDDVENYSTSHLIDLVYRMGLITRPEWRRLSRSYEIRRDLEHEDDEYEAGVEDCIYIFQTCVNVVLSRDPINLLRVLDVKELVEQPQPSIPTQSLVDDFSHAPQPRQEEIGKFLISTALNVSLAELVRQNAFLFLNKLSDEMQSATKLTMAGYIQERITRSCPTRLLMRVAYAANVMPYLKQAHRKDFFNNVLLGMQQVGYRWRAYENHGELLRSFQEVGGLLYCPEDVRYEILKWLALAYIGEPGGRTVYGNVRYVYFSNTAARIIPEIVRDASVVIQDDIKKLAKDKQIKDACTTIHIERRWEAFLDLLTEKETEDVILE